MSTSSVPPSQRDPRFPIGKFQRDEAAIADHAAAIATLAALPENLRSAIDGLTTTQLDTPYREGGWTVRQLVHHIADSHMNAYVRIKLALTEDWPTVKSYDEKLWAELPDSLTGSVDVSVDLIAALHRRWARLLRLLSEEQWQRGYTHPMGGRQTVAEAVAMYDWHSRHHIAHISELRKRMGW